MAWTVSVYLDGGSKKNQHVRIERCWFKHYIDFMRLHVHFHVWSFLVSHTPVRKSFKTLLVWRTRTSNNVSLDIAFSHIFTHTFPAYLMKFNVLPFLPYQISTLWLKRTSEAISMTTRSQPFLWLCKWQIVINDSEKALLQIDIMLSNSLRGNWKDYLRVILVT